MADLVLREDQTPAVDRGRRSAPDLQRLLDLHRGVTEAASRVVAGPHWPVIRVEDAFSRADAVRRVDDHARWLAERADAASTPDALRGCRDMAVRAVSAEPDQRVVVAAVALLVGSRARQPDNAAAYIRALEFDLVDLGFSPTVVTVALQRLRREAKFTPEIPEVLAACRVERDRLSAVVQRIDRALAYRAAVESALAQVPALRARAEAFSNPGAEAWDRAVLGEGRSG